MNGDAELLASAYSDPSLRDARACPFCRNKTLAIAPGPKPRLAHRNTWLVFCPGCGCRGPLGESPQHAVTKWNGQGRPFFRELFKRGT